MIRLGDLVACPPQGDFFRSCVTDCSIRVFKIFLQKIGLPGCYAYSFMLPTMSMVHDTDYVATLGGNFLYEKFSIFLADLYSLLVLLLLIF